MCRSDNPDIAIANIPVRSRIVMFTAMAAMNPISAPELGSHLAKGSTRLHEREETYLTNTREVENAPPKYEYGG